VRRAKHVDHRTTGGSACCWPRPLPASMPVRLACMAAMLQGPTRGTQRWGVHAPEYVMGATLQLRAHAQHVLLCWELCRPARFTQDASMHACASCLPKVQGNGVLCALKRKCPVMHSAHLYVTLLQFLVR